MRQSVTIALMAMVLSAVLTVFAATYQAPVYIPSVLKEGYLSKGQSGVLINPGSIGATSLSSSTTTLQSSPNGLWYTFIKATDSTLTEGALQMLSLGFQVSCYNQAAAGYIYAPNLNSATPTIFSTGSNVAPSASVQSASIVYSTDSATNASFYDMIQVNTTTGYTTAQVRLIVNPITSGSLYSIPQSALQAQAQYAGSNTFGFANASPYALAPGEIAIVVGLNIQQYNTTIGASFNSTCNDTTTVDNSMGLYVNFAPSGHGNTEYGNLVNVPMPAIATDVGDAGPIADTWAISYTDLNGNGVSLVPLPVVVFTGDSTFSSTASQLSSTYTTVQLTTPDPAPSFSTFSPVGPFSPLSVPTGAYTYMYSTFVIRDYSRQITPCIMPQFVGPSATCVVSAAVSRTQVASLALLLPAVLLALIQ